jgi:polyribonucleotide nucleotidyltransferase
MQIRVITKLPNFEQFYKGKVKTHKYFLYTQSMVNGPDGLPTQPVQRHADQG